MLTKIKLSGLSCSACQKLTTKRIGQIMGVSNVIVDLISADITADRKIELEEINSILAGTNYSAASYGE